MFVRWKGDSDLHERDNKEQTPLHYATLSGNLEMIELFLKEGFDVNARNLEGQIPLHLAIEKRQSQEVIQFLINNGADVNARDNKGQSVADYIAKWGEKEMLDMLPPSARTLSKPVTTKLSKISEIDFEKLSKVSQKPSTATSKSSAQKDSDKTVKEVLKL